MDPVSVFKALYDTKCVKFGRYDLKSGAVAPYYIKLRRLPLYPALMEAIVAQVHEKFLTNQALAVTMSQLRRHYRQRSDSMASQSIRSASQLVASCIQEQKNRIHHDDEQLVHDKLSAIDINATDSDSQLGEEDIETNSGEDCEWDSVVSASSQRNFDPIISSVPYGSVPLAVAVSFRARLPYLFEQQEATSHGDHQPLVEDFDTKTRTVFPYGAYKLHKDLDNNEVVGLVARKQQVILVKDVISSGESILEAARQLEKQNLKVEFVICIIDREENGINLLLEQAGIHVLSLYKISAILRVLETTGRITSKQFISTRNWILANQLGSIGVDPSKSITKDNSTIATTTDNWSPIVQA